MGSLHFKHNYVSSIFRFFYALWILKFLFSFSRVCFYFSSFKPVILIHFLIFLSVHFLSGIIFPFTRNICMSLLKVNIHHYFTNFSTLPLQFFISVLSVRIDRNVLYLNVYDFLQLGHLLLFTNNLIHLILRIFFNIINYSNLDPSIYWEFKVSLKLQSNMT